MDLRAKSDECLILRGRDYNEADRLLTVFGRGLGKMSCLARGVRRANSSLKAGCQLFSYTTLTFAPTKGNLHLITQSAPKNVHGEICADLTKIAIASYISEMLDIVLPEEKPQEQMFILAETMLSLLAAGAEPALVLGCFRARLLGLMGYKLNLAAKCRLCGRESAHFKLNPRVGGLCCPDCVRERLPVLSLAAVRLMRSYAEGDLRRLADPNLPQMIDPVAISEATAAESVALSYYIGEAAKRAEQNLTVYYRV